MSKLFGGVQWNYLTARRLEDRKCLEQYGYKVYSQNDEDGIIQEIFRRIGVTNKIFVEFGVQDGLESNCHYLLFQEWKGLWIEGSTKYINDIRQKFFPVIQSGQLKCKYGFVTKDNINGLISEEGISGEIDLLSIDIDGNEYYVWNAINIINPRVVIIEYNGKFPPDCDWKMAYNENHIWDGSDWHGASLKAMENLGRKLGYQLVGTNLIGANAFFVRSDLTGDKFYVPATAEKLYNPLRLHIRHASGAPARYCLKGQKDNYGLLNYKPEEIAVAGYGFHDFEGSHERYYRWSAELNSQILVRGDRKGKVLKIPYFITEGVLRQRENYLLGIKVDGRELEKINILQSEGELEVEFPVKQKELLKVEIEVPFLWKPSVILHTDDERELGIAIIFSKISIE